MLWRTRRSLNLVVVRAGVHDELPVLKDSATHSYFGSTLVDVGSIYSRRQHSSTSMWALYSLAIAQIKSTSDLKVASSAKPII